MQICAPRCIGAKRGFLLYDRAPVPVGVFVVRALRAQALREKGKGKNTVYNTTEIAILKQTTEAIFNGKSGKKCSSAVEKPLVSVSLSLPTTASFASGTAGLGFG